MVPGTFILALGSTTAHFSLHNKYNPQYYTSELPVKQNCDPLHGNNKGLGVLIHHTEVICCGVSGEGAVLVILFTCQSKSPFNVG